MNILFLSLISFVLIIGIITVFIYLLWTARKTLLKDQTSWSAKDIPIKRNNKNTERDFKAGMLLQIEEQANAFLNSQTDEEK